MELLQRTNIDRKWDILSNLVCDSCHPLTKINEFYVIEIGQIFFIIIDTIELCLFVFL